MTDSRRRCLSVPALALVLILLAPAGAAPAGIPGPSEPSASLEVGLRLVGLTGSGEAHHALVEVLLLSRSDLSAFRLEQGRVAEPSARTPVDLPGEAKRLRAWQARRVQISLDLASGIVHHLVVAAEGVDPSGGVVRGTGYLRVNLDPALMPEEVDLEDEGLLQYGAAPSGSTR